MKIGDREIWPGSPAYIVAEIGINHNGDSVLARELIEAAAEAGADAVKFQLRVLPDSIPIHMMERRKDTPWGEMSYYEYKKRLEFSSHHYINEFRPLATVLCLDLGVSVWGRQAAFVAANMHDFEATGSYQSIFDFLKIPSAYMRDDRTLHMVATRDIPFFWSTGMHTTVEIQATMGDFARYHADNWGVLYCNSQYPTPNKHLNLRAMKHWIDAQLFRPNPVGYSGHEVGLATTLAARAMGAVIIERHITMDRAMWGSDQAASVEPQGFARLVRDIRSIEEALGSWSKIVYLEELEKRKEILP